MTPEPGALIGNAYKVTAVLGQGGMGDVLAGIQLSTGRKAAIKTLRPEVRNLPEFMERFRREAIAASRIRSDHVAKLVDFLEDDALGPVIVFEYLEGQSLAEALANDTCLSLEQTHPIVSQMLEGLADAHAVGVVHRDLKPGNVFLELRSGSPTWVKILDFGISKLPSGGKGWEVLTKTGQSLGTFSYMAPEQIEGPSQVDKRADLYSCGAVVFRMLTGSLPHVARGVPRLVMEKLNRPAKRLSQARPDLSFSPALEAFVAKLLERQPDARFSSAHQARQEWETLALGRVNTEVKASSSMSAASSQNPKTRGPGSGSGTSGRQTGAPRPSTRPPRPGDQSDPGGSAEQPHPRPAPSTLSSGSPRHPAPGPRPGASRFAARTKTILGQPSPVQAPHKPPSIPTRIERPLAQQEAPSPAPPRPPSPTAKAPPPPQRNYEKAPDPDDIEEDEAPTAMFVHPVKYTYDPDGPPQQAESLDDEDDEDDYEPATAIHVSPYRGDGSPGMPPAPSDFGQPASPGGPPLGYPPAASQSQPVNAPIASVAPTPPPGGQYAPAAIASSRSDARLQQTQQLQAIMPQPLQVGGTPISTDAIATFVDPDAAPVWLKAMAVSSVVSALTVLGVLGWMITQRF